LGQKKRQTEAGPSKEVGIGDADNAVAIGVHDLQLLRG
jgi:hypothetical protein